MVANPKRNISFDEPNHTYKDEYNEFYTSVTTVISKYYEKFNENYWANYKARETGLSAEAIKQNWKEIREYSQDKGNKIHKELENSINESTGKQKFEFDNTDQIDENIKKFGYKLLITSTNLDVLKQTPLAKKYPKIYKFLEANILDGWSMYAEKRIYWADFLIAGTIDCLLVKDKQFMIVDWKTNKDQLMFKAGYWKKDKVTRQKTGEWIDKKEYFLRPINQVEYCKGNIYTLQLSLYAYLMEMWGFRCIGLVLFHIRDNQELLDYNISYLEWACQLLCIDFKNASIIEKRNKMSLNDSEDFSIT